MKRMKREKAGAFLKGTENITGFYWKQYNLKWSKYEMMLIFKWRQLRELRFSLYDVNNKHQCFLDKDWRSNVIQPFHCVDNFYGCLACGKFHICKMHANSCHIVCDEKTHLKTCRYSGRMLTIEDNLEVANWLEERRVENESSYIDQKGPNPQNQKAVSMKKLSFVGQGKNSIENGLLIMFKPGNENNNTQKSPKKRKLDRNDYSEYYDLSINSIEEEEDDENGEELIHIDHETSISKNVPILSEKDKETIEKIKKSNKKRKLEKIDYDEAPEFVALDSKNIETEETHSALSTLISTTNEIESDCELDINIESLEFDCDDESNDDNGDGRGGGGGGGDDYGEEMDNYATNQRTCINYEDSSYDKNYHNNIQYNNEYYFFLNHIIKGEDRAKERQNNQDKMSELLAMYAKDMREEYRIHSKFHHHHHHDDNNDDNKKTEDSIEEFSEELTAQNPYKKNALNESITAKIQNETHSILNNLLHVKVQRKEVSFSLSDPEYTKTLSILCQYYTNLIRNITLLVYQSPILDQVARERNLKNQNQTNKAFISTIDLNSLDKIQKSVDYHEHTLCPLKICRSLLLHLFVTPKALNDSAGFRILLWSRDSWLESFNNEKKNYSLITDYYNRMISSSHNPTDIAITKLKQKGVEKHCRIFKDSLTGTSTKIVECITYYSNDPLWLRHMIHR